jgi:hypothetical protein
MADWIPPQCSSIAIRSISHSNASGSVTSTISGHKLLIVLERKLLSFIAYRHQASNEFVVALDRLSYRAIVRRLKADAHKQFAPYIVHALCGLEIEFVCLWFVDDTQYLCLCGDGGNRCAISFICVCVAFNLVEFFDDFVCGLFGLFGGDILEFADAVHNTA